MLGYLAAAAAAGATAAAALDSPGPGVARSDWTGTLLVATLVLGVLFALGAAITAFGCLAAALRAVRDEPVGIDDLLVGLRRLPAVVVGTAITVAAICAAVPVLVFSTWPPYVVAGTIGDATIRSGVPATVAVTALSCAIAVALLALAAIAVSYVLAGIAQWPLLVIDEHIGAVAAMRRSWTMMRGRRLMFASLAFAVEALWALGVLAFGVGLVLTTAFALTAYAALYARLCAGRVDPGPARPPHTLASWLVDGALWARLLAAGYILALVATVAPIIEWTKATWAPFGLRTLLVPLLVPPLAVTAIYGACVLAGRRPGRRLIGAGWGRWGWLSLGLLPTVLTLVWALLRLVPDAVNGIDALAVGQETGRIVTDDLPAGYERHMGRAGDGAWFRRMHVANEDETTVTFVDYTITDTTGTPYLFRIETFYQESTAREAFERLAGDDAVTASTPDAEIAVPRATTAGPAHRVARSGTTVLAGETDAAHADDLERLVARQIERLPAAREAVADVYDRLPKTRQILVQESR